MNQTTERTEQAFAAYVSENQRTFDALKCACPKLYTALLDLNKASFMAGCNYESEVEFGWEKKVNQPPLDLAGMVKGMANGLNSLAGKAVSQ